MTAWKFLKFLTSAAEEKALYQVQLQGKLIGLPYSRVDLQSELLTDPFAGAFVVQGPYYKSWYLTSGTQDAGLDEEIINEYQTAVNGVLAGQDASGVLQNIQGDIQKSIDKFTKPPSPSPTP